LKSPTPAMVQSLDTGLTMPPPLMVVPFSSHRPRAPEVWRHRMSAVPSPLKSRSTVAGGGPATGKTTAAVRTHVILTVHVPVPLHPSPLQPVKRDPLALLAIRVTLVPASKAALQVLPQLIPAGLEVTMPLPVPAFVTVSMNCWSVKVAVTLRACV